LDEKAISGLVDEGIQASFDQAYDVYTKGGYSKSVAKLTLSGSLGASLKKDDKVVGVSQKGEQIVLMAADDYDNSATSVELVYADTTSFCSVGGLAEAERVYEGCTYPFWLSIRGECRVQVTTFRSSLASIFSAHPFSQA
jgi:hypothetical protein